MMECAGTEGERELISRLSQLAVCDPLTGLHNRGAVKELFARTLEQATERGDCLGILYIDLDDFSAVNKLHGQAVGDVIISRIANRLRLISGERDVIVRTAGDEFLLITTENGTCDLLTKAQHIVDTLREPHVLENGKTVRVTARVGTALFPEHGTDYEELIAAAELAQHHAKKIGDDIVAFNPEMLDAEHKRVVFEHDVGLALERGELSIVFQPQADAGTCAITGFEALARWQHPELGAVSPADFIPAAEASGAICSIGAYVLREACRVAATWTGALRIAVNVSPVQIERGDFVQLIKDALRESGLAPDRLEIEVTESLFIQNLPYASKILSGVKQLGVTVALDDFGTGYSSLSTLRAFPFDRIKIDRSFVFDMVRNSDAAAIVDSVLGLGRALGLAVVAEGVETQEQRSLLRTLGCQQIQGYLIGKPMPAGHYAAAIGKASKHTSPAIV
ncbi:MAG TPA: EAL domain-containing protein [Hyphomicrobium sp.]|nr:EAL domain-containing protein [Hyphomicrobium sp.]